VIEHHADNYVIFELSFLQLLCPFILTY